MSIFVAQLKSIASNQALSKKRWFDDRNSVVRT